MRRLCQQWEAPQSTFGDLAVIGFLLVQCLDGVFTYVGVRIWGPGIEANPLVASAMGVIGLGTGVAAMKLMAVAFGVVLHLRRVHNLIVLLTFIYLTAAILPWTALLLIG